MENILPAIVAGVVVGIFVAVLIFSFIKFFKAKDATAKIKVLNLIALCTIFLFAMAFCSEIYIDVAGGQSPGWLRKIGGLFLLIMVSTVFLLQRAKKKVSGN